jgi:hypothetical protein
VTRRARVCRLRWSGAIAACVLAWLASGAAPARSAPWAPVALTDSLGAEIDSLERRSYGLFPDLDGFRTARTLTDGSGYRVEVSSGAGAEERTRSSKLSANAWEATRLHALAVERYRDLAPVPPSSEDEVQYRLALRFASTSRYGVARALLEDLVERAEGTPLGDEVGRTRVEFDRILASDRALFLPRATHDQSGRTDLLVFSGFYGLWTGIAVPVWLDSEDAQVYAAGLLAAPPLALILASSASRGTEMGVGRAHVISLGGWLGTWQGVGWAAVSDVDGNQAVGIGLLSGLAGITAASVLTSEVHFSEGHGSLTGNSLLWGAWFGLVGGVLAGAEDDDLLRASLVGTDALVLGTAVGARNARMSKNRVRLISLLGVVGTAFGFGVDLLAEVDDEKAAFAVAGIGSVAGLVAGVNMTKDHDAGKDLSEAPSAPEERWSVAPHAGVIPDPESGRPIPAMGVRVSF